MTNLNIKSLMLLGGLFVADIVANKTGRILNLVSTAAFQSGSTMAVYYSTKNCVLFLSEAMN